MGLAEMLSVEFVRFALLAGLLVGIICGVLSVFVVLERLSFIGVGISHGTLCGVSIGLLLGIDPLLAAMVFSILLAWLIGWLHAHRRVPQDTAVGIVFPIAMGAGLSLMSLSSGYQQDIFGYLVGSLVAVGREDLYVLSALTIFTLAVMFLYGRELIIISFQPEVATVDGYRTNLVNYFLLALLAAVVVISVRVVGIILVSALLVLPAATTFMFRVGILRQPIVAALLGASACILGLVLSLIWDIPPGAAIVLVAGAIYLLALGIRALPVTKQHGGGLPVGEGTAQ